MKNTELIYLDKKQTIFQITFLGKNKFTTRIIAIFLTLTNLKFIKSMNQLKEIYPTRKLEPIILDIFL